MEKSYMIILMIRSMRIIFNVKKLKKQVKMELEVVFDILKRWNKIIFM